MTPKTANATNFNFPHCPEGTHGTWPLCFPNSTPHPTASPVPEKTDCPEETVQPSATPEETSSPEPTPVEETPAPTEQPTVALTEPHGDVSAPVCTDGGAPKFAPTVTYAWRTGTDVDVKFTTTDVQDFILWYGPTGKALVQHTGVFHNADAHPSYQIHLVNQPIDVIACAVSPCGIQTCGVRFIDGPLYSIVR